MRVRVGRTGRLPNSLLLFHPLSLLFQTGSASTHEIIQNIVGLLGMSRGFTPVDKRPGHESLILKMLLSSLNYYHWICYLGCFPFFRKILVLKSRSEMRAQVFICHKQTWSLEIWFKENNRREVMWFPSLLWLTESGYYWSLSLCRRFSICFLQPGVISCYEKQFYKISLTILFWEPLVEDK